MCNIVIIVWNMWCSWYVSNCKEVVAFILWPVFPCVNMCVNYHLGIYRCPNNLRKPPFVSQYARRSAHLPAQTSCRKHQGSRRHVPARSCGGCWGRSLSGIVISVMSAPWQMNQWSTRSSSSAQKMLKMLEIKFWGWKWRMTFGG